MTPEQKKSGTWLAIATAAVCCYEGLSLTEYPDVGGVPTICYGETKNVKPGETATKEQCDELLSKRLAEFNAGVDSCVMADLPDSHGELPLYRSVITLVLLLFANRLWSGVSMLGML
jgi:GH24 family phage-related lysozyme (muramidase)